MGEVTQLLDQVRQGDKSALERFYARVYYELESIAKSHLRRQAPLTLIEPSSLVNEVYFRIARQESLPGEGRSAFLAYASAVMRSVIIDYLRSRGSERRGGDRVKVTLKTAVYEGDLGVVDFDSLNLALSSLQNLDERAHRVVELRYFGGMEIEEIASLLGISSATVKRDWTKARLFLRHQLVDESESP